MYAHAQWSADPGNWKSALGQMADDEVHDDQAKESHR